jgi:ketosteroid isomerase-like protein
MVEHRQSDLPDDAIAAMRATFVEALARGDAAAAAAVYTDTARVLPPAAEPMEGRAAIEAFWRAGIESGISEVELESLELDQRDGLGYEIGRYALRLRAADGATVVDRGKYVLVHRRQPDGTWRRAVEMFSPDGQPTDERAKEEP